MTLGEVWVGGAKGCTDVIGVTLGTGVGGGILTREAACWKVRGVSAVSWDTSEPTRWMACSAPAARRLLGAVRRHHRSGAGRTAPEPEVEGWPRDL